MSDVVVGSGQTVSSGTVSSGNTETVESGGAIVDFTISAGGADVVESGGSATSTTVSGGGLELVESGGVATSTTVSSGGVEVIAPGGSDPGINALPGAIVASTGVVVISAGSATSNTSVTGITLDSPGEYEIVLPGGTAISTSVSGGAEELVFSGGAVSDTTVGSGGLENLDGGSATSTTVNSGGLEVISFGGVASGTILSGAKLDVVSGGSNAGTIKVADRSGLELGGTFTNTGTIALDGVTKTAKLYVADTGLTLSGGGKVTLTGDSEIVAGPDATVKATIGGTVTSGDVISLTISNTDLSLSETVSYQVTSAVATAYTSVDPALTAQNPNLTLPHAA